MVKKVFFKVPGQPYVKREFVRNTKFIQAKKSKGKIKKGYLLGRKRVSSRGDVIRRNRVNKGFTLVKKSRNKRGHIRSIRVKKLPGQLI